MKKLLSFSLFLVTFVSGCGSGTKAILISLSTTTATVQAAGTMQFTATVANDSANKGVNWSVSCSAASCGSVSPTTTPSGTPTTYTAPSAPPASNLTVTITVTSVADSTKTAAITITIPAIAVAVAPATASVLAGATAQFTATVTNDPATKGVTWSVTCSVSQCGSVAPTTTASGTPTTYTAPATPPATNLTVTITATSVSDTTKANSATITVPAVTISVAPPTPMVLPGATQLFTATVTNTSNTAVTWTLTQGGAACTAVCGTLSSASANPVTYTPPVPPAKLTITLTATSAADTTKTAAATITVPAITVSVAPTSANVAVSGFTSFTATVGNDGANKGVTWMLTQNGTACAPTCGTINAATPSGSATSYTAPASMPANPTVTVTATSVTDPTKSATATVTITPISVSVSPATASVVVNGTQQFTATVTFDAHNLGVSWTITSGGTPCPVGCGSVSPSSSLSGVAVTYTAPSAVPGGPVTLTATSTTDSTKSAAATITVTAAPPISVSVAPTTATVAVNRTQPFTATVTNDPATAGVTWALTQAGVACSPACGAVAPASTPSGTATTYTAPASVPTPATVTITATSVTDTTMSASATITISTNACSGYGSGNESVLTGQYAFLVQGFVGNGATSPFVGAASIAADGKGNITSGEADINQVSGGPAHLIVTATGSSYSIGSDNRGCVTLSFGTSNPVTFHFAVGGITAGVASTGRLIEFDDTTGNGTRNAGILRLQTVTDFANSKLQPRYAFGFGGFDSTGGHFAVVGSFSTGGAGTTITNGFDDANDAGTLFSALSNGSGTIGAISATSGRATATFMTPGGVTNNSVFYVVNASEFFAVSADTLTANTPITSGRGIVTGSSFSNSSLNGNYIIHLSGAHANGTGDVVIGLVTLTGGTLSGTTYENNAGVASTNTVSNGTYSVDATSGRVTITGAGAHNPVLYLTTLTDGISAFIEDTGGTAGFGLVEFQPVATYTTNSLAGQYFVGNEDPTSNTVTNSVATATVTTAGTATATSDKSGPFSPFLTTGQVMMLTFTITNPNGTGNFGPNTVFITNGSRVFTLDQSSTSTPSITVAEK
jgi:hypothetical protein